MKNILAYLYENLKNEDKVIAQELVNNKVVKLKNRDVLKFYNYLTFNIPKANFDKKIGIFMENSIGFVNAFYGISLTRNIVVSINSSIETTEELNHIIDDNNLEYIITDSKLVDMLEKSNIKNTINYDNIHYEKYLSNCEIDKTLPNFEDVMIISYTSGTSGNFSKGVEIMFKNVSFVSEEYKKVYKLTEQSKSITVLPLWHNYAMFACLTSAIVANSSLIIMKKWDLNTFLKINEILKPDIFPGSPYMYIDIINNTKEMHKLKNLRVCDSGGDSLPIECINRFEKLTGAVITEGYGLTETTSLTHFNYSASERKVGSLGKCVSDVQCKILDLNNNELQDDTYGLLWINGPMVFKGYVGNDSAKVAVVKNADWFNTNDVVKRDKDGFYFLAGRYTDVKQIGENNNQLRELENALYKFIGIKRVHLKSHINEVGEFPYFDIVAELNANYNIQDLYDYINLNLRKFVINDIKIVDSLPTTGTGKIKRNKINEILK